MGLSWCGGKEGVWAGGAASLGLGLEQNEFGKATTLRNPDF